MGTGKRLREFHHSIRITAVQPDSPFHGIEGWKHMPTAIVPGLYDPTLADEVLTIGTETSQDMARRLSAEEGLITGVSGGANVVAAVEVASALPPSDLVVTVLPDRGDRSLGEEWREGRP
jgi:cysteine synthase B